MDKREIIDFREATNNDIAFLSEIVVSAASTSGVEMSVSDLSVHPDTYQYARGIPQGK